MKNRRIIYLLILLYLASRLISLTKLPIFADEAIYIRWAQMIFDDPKQFTFLPLYDGKTPLFIWLLVPLVNYLSIDPLWIARFLSVVSGGLLMAGIWLIVKESGGKKLAQIFSGLLVILIPFTFFYNRMALIDTMLTMWLSFSYWAYLRARKNNYKLKWTAISGLFWGLALLTKTSAFYFLLVIGGITIYDICKHKKIRNIKVITSILISLILGLIFIGWLRVSPLFPFLFQRTSDFAYNPQQIIDNFVDILRLNIYRISKWLWIYMTPAVVAPILWRLMRKNNDVSFDILLISTILFLLPFILTGHLLSSRYFLPVVIWLIPLLSITLAEMKKSFKLIMVGTIVVVIYFSVRFMWPLWINPGKTPFSSEDISQYLTEWSAGYGIPEIRDYIANQAKNHKMIVLTEGSFGTLPDGLFIYFHNSPLQNNLEIHGIEQPVSGLSNELLSQIVDGDVYLVVNENRLTMDIHDPKLQLINSYPKPADGYPLLFFKINSTPNQ